MTTGVRFCVSYYSFETDSVALKFEIISIEKNDVVMRR